MAHKDTLKLQELSGKPRISIRERIAAILSDEFRLSSLLLMFRNPKTVLFQYRLRMGAIVMQNRLPIRNVDDAINWDNFFQAMMQTSVPIKRNEVFPEGTDGLTENEIWQKLMEYVKPRTIKPNFGPNTTAYDVVEFPEVMGEGIREYGMSINRLPFVRTTDSWQGRPDNGYASSSFMLAIDLKDKRGKIFHKELEKLCQEFTHSNVEAYLFGEAQEDELVGLRLRLLIEAPEDWQEIELGVEVETPDIFMERIAPGFFKQDGSIDQKVEEQAFEDGRYDQYEAYIAEYRKKKNCYANSDQCKAIYTEFWTRVARLADSFRE